jgi:hypothetical protein
MGEGATTVTGEDPFAETNGKKSSTRTANVSANKFSGLGFIALPLILNFAHYSLDNFSSTVQLLRPSSKSHLRHARSYTGNNSSLTRPKISGCNREQKSTLRPMMAASQRVHRKHLSVRC